MVIVDYLKKKDKTQKELAQEVGCSTAFLNAIINGKNTDIKISLVRKLSIATKIPEKKLIDELLGRPDVERPTEARPAP